MSSRIDNFIIREAGGPRFAATLVIGRGAAVATTPGGLPELVGLRVGETQLLPSGGDDTAALNAALALGDDVRLGPGVFQLSSTLVVGSAFESGPGPRLIGSGVNRTRIRMTATGPAVVLRGDYSGIESLTLEGPGMSDVDSTGIRVGQPPAVPFPTEPGLNLDISPIAPRTVTGVTIRDVRVEKAGFGIRLVNAASCTLRGVRVTEIAETGIVSEVIQDLILPAPPLPGPVILTDVRVEGANIGIDLYNSASVTARAVEVRTCQNTGVLMTGGSGHQLGSLRVSQCGAGLVLQGVRATSVDGVAITGCTSGVQVSDSKDVSVTGAEVSGANGSLAVSGSENVIVGAFRSDMSSTAGSSPAPHLTVTSSAGVFVTSLRVVNPSTTPVYEVNVAQAGGRVLFGPHNVTASRINSGGNFAQL